MPAEGRRLLATASSLQDGCATAGGPPDKEATETEKDRDKQRETQIETQKETQIETDREKQTHSGKKQQPQRKPNAPKKRRGCRHESGDPVDGQIRTEP